MGEFILPSWDDVRFFLALARAGSLTAAARHLDVQHTTVARRFAAFEADIQIKLFDRSSRRWTLTPEGKVLLEFASRMEEDVFAFGRAAKATMSLDGTVRVSAPPVFASHYLMPRLAPQLARTPGIAVDLVGESRAVDLERGEADVAIQFSRPTEKTLAARRVGAVEFRLYATPDWARRPETQWRFLGLGDALRDAPQQEALYLAASGRPFALTSNDLMTLFHGCRAGLGIAALPDFLAAEHADLVEIPSPLWPVTREVWLVVHPDVRWSPRIRRVADMLAEAVARRDGVPAKNAHYAQG